MRMFNKFFFYCVFKGKQWLCLNCQVKRATGSSEPQNDRSLVSSSLKSTTTAQTTLQNTFAPGFPERKGLTPAAQPAKAEVAKVSHKEANPATGQKTPQESRKTGPQKQPDQKSQVKQQDSGSFFGLGASKIQSDAAKPSESVSGKMFGFGSSIFSSASTLISSAQTTPPVSPKMAAAKESPKKPQQQRKPEEPQKAKIPPTVQPIQGNPLPKQDSASPVTSKAGHSICPLCKLELNVGCKDPPNFNTCTVCKNTVCNQCGFNPMPNVKEVR